MRASVSAWESGANDEKRCKQCMQEYGASLRLAITRAMIQSATSKAAALSESGEDGRKERGAWLKLRRRCEQELACVALVEYGRELGHASAAGRAALAEAAELTRHEVDDCEAKLGAEHEQTLSLRLCLGEVLRYSRRLDEAYTLHTKTLCAIKERQAADGGVFGRGAMEASRWTTPLEEDANSHLGNWCVGPTLTLHPAAHPNPIHAQCQLPPRQLVRAAAIASGGQSALPVLVPRPRDI